jgi:hypothetical protein
MKSIQKHQNNKYGYGFQAFLENHAFIPYFFNSMFYNPLMSSKNGLFKIVL